MMRDGVPRPQVGRLSLPESRRERKDFPSPTCRGRSSVPRLYSPTPDATIACSARSRASRMETPQRWCSTTRPSRLVLARDQLRRTGKAVHGEQQSDDETSWVAHTRSANSDRGRRNVAHACRVPIASERDLRPRSGNSSSIAGATKWRGAPLASPLRSRPPGTIRTSAIRRPLAGRPPSRRSTRRMRTSRPRSRASPTITC